MRPIKELMQIMLEHVGEINSKCPRGLCSLSFRLLEKGLFSHDQQRAVLVHLHFYTDEFVLEGKWGLYAFEPGLVKPRRELLEKIISEL